MPAFVRQAVNTQSAGTTVVVTITAPTAFDTLVCFTYSNAGDVSGVTGGGVTTWAKLKGPGPISSVWNNIYWGVVDTTPSTSVTVTATSGFILANVAEFSGRSIGADASTSQANGPSAAPSVGPITATRGCIYLANLTTGLSITAGPTGGFTALTNATVSGRSCQGAYLIAPAPSAATCGWTTGSSGSWDMTIGALLFPSGVDPNGVVGTPGV